MTKNKGSSSERILEVSEKLFIEKGYNQTEMKDIAAQIGISRSTLYRHFPAKEILAFYITERILRDELKIDLSLVKGNNGYEKLTNFSIQYLNLCIEKNSLIKYMSEFDNNFTGNYPDIPASREYIKFIQDFKTPIYHYIMEGVEDGSIKPDTQIQLVANTFYTCIYAMVQRVIVRESHYKEEQGYGREMLYCAIELMLKAIKN